MLATAHQLAVDTEMGVDHLLPLLTGDQRAIRMEIAAGVTEIPTEEAVGEEPAVMMLLIRRYRSKEGK